MKSTTTTPAAQTVTVNPLGLLRLPQVLQLLPIGRSSWLAGVKEGRYPQPVKLGPATTCWRASDILSFIDSLGASHE
ncbi:transcriptional regulator, AlpA family [Trichlorobacter thiogenes]|uniref:Transcriptional regulator, AlpA family n=1 Tax=Trichlorobacter thiogenes TaxID=115783 RepID=A0A1T4S324_9BACT|nr:AlpA family phage regulatory protein [Trichlorobacter thiogenes]SKA22582.1 transcriptional regulator, AlpA family [Trichlorobacter thiogenes]